MKTSFLMAFFLGCTVSSIALAASSQPALPMKPQLTLSAARVIADAAEHDALKRGTPGSIAVVDDGGNPLLLERMDDSSVAFSNIAMGKARTAAQFRAPSKNFENAINTGRQAAITSGMLMMSGGEPIVVDGQVVGAVGISTKVPANDDQIATVASHALDAAQ